MLDDVDRGLVQALQISGRASFTRIASVLGVSTQTVARRYRQLRATAGLRVVGLIDVPHRVGTQQWTVRVTAAPHAALDLATALARRPDTTWVKLTSGGTEIFAMIHIPAGDEHALLLRDIPRTAGITAVSAHLMLHTYFGGPTAWRGRTEVLDERQRALLLPTDRPDRPASSPRGPAAGDAPLLAALLRDGRASLADLAAASGATPATVARRLADLEASGALFYDVEIDAAKLGATTMAMLWMAVAPDRLGEVATTLATHPELAVVAATTGSTNLLAQAICADPAALHHYLTHRLGSVAGIRTLETAPVLRTLKATSPVTLPEAGPRRPRSRIELQRRA
ncbi:Lrp/AsnC family transcriptional regulator [Pseudonocardia sp. GCM10023141]|uniref:Lrp/AsnC family transcriptional regulator n=1 Tax=Pseudonocardia sp. GCM10023141 TaxID=3252653 RepID=UPI00360A4F1D